MNPTAVFDSIQQLKSLLVVIGGPFELVIMVAGVAVAAAAALPVARRWHGWMLAGMAGLLVAGEAALMWFHWRLYELAVVISPNGMSRGRIAVPLWVESEKLFVWALTLAILGLCMRRQRNELMSGVLFVTGILAFAAAWFGQPFTDPLPGFFGQYTGFLQATQVGGAAAQQAFEGMESARQFYYNAWYMWVHPPMLFLSYGAFAISFVATLQMIAKRHSSYETTAYRWARFGYVWLTLGMLIGFPWALSAWQGESWWWSGKVNMSLMMWLLYTAYLHARLYLRRRGMWKAVAAIAVLSFAILVLTYVTTYVVPGAHSYATLTVPETAITMSRGMPSAPVFVASGGHP